MSDFEISENDVGTTRTFPLTDSTGLTPYNLTGKTVTLAYDTYPTPSNRVTRSLTVNSPATDGIVSWTIQSADTATPGQYKGNIVITSTGFQETIPLNGFTFDVVSIV